MFGFGSIQKYILIYYNQLRIIGVIVLIATANLYEYEE
jgi:hypothetical protein